MNTARPDDPRDGEPHDAWLQAALRHAPDAGAAPPPALSEAILREARRATGTSPPARSASSLAQRLLAAWAWLARAPVATAFASLMIATVVGVMWWDRPREEMLPPREAPTAPPASPAVAPAQPRAKATAPTAPVAPTRSADAAHTAAPSPPPRAAPPARVGDAPRKAAAEPDPAQRARQPQADDEARNVERPAAPVADASIASSSAPPPAAAPTLEAAPAAKAELRAVAAAPAAPPAPMAQGLARRDAIAPLGSLRTSVATQPERWTWQRDAGPVSATNTALMQWLQRVGETARGRWVPQTGRMETAAPPAATLRLLQDGRVHTTLRLDADGIEVEESTTGARLRAALPAAEATALHVELDQATR